MKDRNHGIAAGATTFGKAPAGGLPTGVLRSDTPVWQLTVQEFVELLESVLRNHAAVPESVARDPPRMVHGLDGLCEIVGCSKSTAMRLKKSGILDEAIVQTGRKIIIDADKALDILYNQKKQVK